MSWIMISQTIGSGGAKIGNLLAKRLHVEYYDDRRVQKYAFCLEAEAN